MKIIAQSADAGKRLDTFLHERLPEYSRSRIQAWIADGRVAVPSAVVRASLILRGGEEIEVTPSAPPPLRAEAEDLPLNILFSDDDVVVVDKPAGMVVHAGAGHHSGTLVNALVHHFGSLSSVNGELRPGIVHRLDKDTSGILVVARNDAAHQALARQFQSRSIRKIYLAIVQGIPKRSEGTINTPITRDPVRRTRMTTQVGRGRTAVTHYRLLQTVQQKYSLLEVRIETGRTHQIRVHLSSIGHPVAGDRLYGAATLPGRFLLHAHRLSFQQPTTGAPIEIVSPMPEDFANFLAQKP